MIKLKERFNSLRQHVAEGLRAFVKKPAPAPPPKMPDEPARDLLTRGAGKIHKIDKPFSWKSR